MSDNDYGGDNLGSLSQKARTKSLKSAQSILIIIGIIGTLAYGFMFTQAEAEVDREITKAKNAAGPGIVFDNAALKEARDADVRTVKLFYGAFALAAVAMIVLGICVYKAPVVCTVLGLVIYVAAWLIPVVLLFLADEKEEAMKAMVGGIIIKILIIIGLVKAIQAAIAYQAELKEAY